MLQAMNTEHDGPDAEDTCRRQVPTITSGRHGQAPHEAGIGTAQGTWIAQAY